MTNRAADNLGIHGDDNAVTSVSLIEHPSSDTTSIPGPHSRTLTQSFRVPMNQGTHSHTIQTKGNMTSVWQYVCINTYASALYVYIHN